MTANSSSSNFSVLAPPSACDKFTSTTSISLYTVRFVTFVFLLPLFIFVLYLGCQRWRKSVTTTHSDVFTYNMSVLELIGTLGFVFVICGLYRKNAIIYMVGSFIFSATSPAEALFHLLTCVERYLAVVHPVTYMKLRQSGGVRIRNISIGLSWLFSFGSVFLVYGSAKFNEVFTHMFLLFTTVVVCFCSLSVLCVLIRPGPGEVGRNRERVDQSKQRAFYTMVTISGALLLKSLGTLLTFVIDSSDGDNCLIELYLLWLSLPSSMVLPLLFLHRAGKLPGCKRDAQSG